MAPLAYFRASSGRGLIQTRITGYTRVKPPYQHIDALCYVESGYRSRGMKKLNALFDHRFDCINWTIDPCIYMYIWLSGSVRLTFGYLVGGTPDEMKG